ncbi:TonB-dependent receptor [Seonamhaeicola sp.]|uniref:TonB-dependent receptor n=1 Tax=Seonamhaeicola sp. TaxID=1912245 RepID=UPI00261A4EED|nr:TonB-dependent receptor [Seonamhaeicola sp.]
MNNQSIYKVFNEIEHISEFRFLFESNQINLDRKVTISVKKKKITNILKILFDNTDIVYKIRNRQIILMKKQSFPEDNPGHTTVIGKEEDQGQEIKGIVTDKDGLPLAGVNIIIEGTTTGVQTDFDGKYSIIATEGDVLVFSYVGMNTRKITVGTATTVDLVMRENLSKLEEVVVVGYGVKKKENLTGAVDYVEGEVLEDRGIQNAGQGLQGAIANLNVVTNPGSPGRIGQGSTFQIRGLADINGGSAPLILIDGVQGDLNLLNPNDIESVTVLKDAASAAIYGARATFGVILVTTKKGSRGKMKVSFNSMFSMNSQTNVPKVVNSLRYAEVMNDAAANSGWNPIFGPDQLERIRQYVNNPGSIPTTIPEPGDPSRWSYALGNDNVNYFEAYFRSNMPSQKHDFAVSGGSEKTDFRISLGYLDQDGVYAFGGDNFKRYNVLANINTELNDILNFSFQTIYNRGITNEPFGYAGLVGDYFHTPFTRQPHWALYDPNGHPLWTSQIQFFEGSRSILRSDELKLLGKLVIEPIEGWQTTLRYSYGKLVNENFGHQAILQAHAVDGTPYNIQPNNLVRKELSSRDFQSLEVFSSYGKQIGGHNFNLLVGGQKEIYDLSGLSGVSPNLVSDAIPSINTGTGKRDTNDDIDQWANIGFFGRFNYDFEEKYLLEVNARYDGTSKFPKGKRWGFFPSASAAWNIAKENFFKIDEISSLKLRAGYGSLGNQQINNYLFFATVPILNNLGHIIGDERPNYIGAPGLVSNQLTWSTSNTLDLGIDATLFKNRLSVGFGVFETKTVDMIGPAEALPAVLGVAVPVTNNADTETKGFELKVGWQDTINENFEYNVELNLSDSFTEVTRYNNPQNTIWGFYKGKRVGEIWGYTTKGIIQTQQQLDNIADQQTYIYGGNWNLGDIEYTDLNGDGAISQGDNTLDDPGDLTVIGNTTPRYSFGLRSGFKWKGIDFNMFWQGVLKRDVWLGGIPFFGITGSWTQQVYETTTDYWTPENTDAYFARPYAHWETGKNQITQTRFLQNAAYARLKNIQIGYTLPKSILQTIGVQRLRVYASGENLLTITSIDENFDPERLHGNWGNGKSYPLFKTITMGLNIEF